MPANILGENDKQHLISLAEADEIYDFNADHLRHLA